MFYKKILLSVIIASCWGGVAIAQVKKSAKSASFKTPKLKRSTKIKGGKSKNIPSNLSSLPSSNTPPTRGKPMKKFKPPVMQRGRKEIKVKTNTKLQPPNLPKNGATVKKANKFKSPHVSRRQGKIICPIFKKNKYPYQGIGFKLGDPFAITYKYYPNEHWGLVGDVGVAASALYSQYHKDLFQNYIPDDLETTETVDYLSHTVPVDWSFQAKFIYQWKIDAVFKGLRIYAGLGWQWRLTDLKYDYSYTKDDLATSEGRILEFNFLRFTQGGIGVFGFEYAYFSLPISAFLETEIFFDTFTDPGYYNFQGGIGIRYIF